MNLRPHPACLLDEGAMGISGDGRESVVKVYEAAVSEVDRSKFLVPARRHKALCDPISAPEQASVLSYNRAMGSVFMALLFLGGPQQPVGEFAVATNRDGNWEIYSISDDGNVAKNLTNNPAQDLDPSWFPDGKQIAFYSNRAGNSDIFVMNADGTGVTNLTSHESTDTGPAVSPDGKYILFMSTRDHAEGEIYVMDADGGNVRRLTNNDLYEELPSWSPDGRQIAFCRQLPAETESGATNAEIFLMNVSGSNVRRMTHLDSFDSCPVWNIDGKRILFHYSDADGAGIMSMSSDGQDLKLLSQPTGDWYPHWIPGNRVLFVSGAAAQYNVYVMNADGNGRRRLSDHPGRDHKPVLRPAVR